MIKSAQKTCFSIKSAKFVRSKLVESSDGAKSAIVLNKFLTLPAIASAAIAKGI